MRRLILFVMPTFLLRPVETEEETENEVRKLVVLCAKKGPDKKAFDAGRGYTIFLQRPLSGLLTHVPIRPDGGAGHYC